VDAVRVELRCDLVGHIRGCHGTRQVDDAIGNVSTI
jgi:hypothetical protein